MAAEEVTAVQVHRVLEAEPVRSLVDHEQRGGGRGLTAARAVDPAVVIETIEASGLRGRGGGGFPTGRKWRTIAEFASRGSIPATVVVNAAEGEPGSYKDRSIILGNPFRVLEGALIAAHAVGADGVLVAIKSTFTAEAAALRSALAEIEAAGWTNGVPVAIVEGPGAYLYGEETALLEVLDGRPPFPRVSNPWHRGVEEQSDGSAPATLVNNAETLANVPGIVVEGADWFRSVGTDDSPGTIVCTVSGDVTRPGVVEVAMGTPLRELLEEHGGGARKGRRLVAALSGVANPFVPADGFDAPLSHEGMAAAGAGLGTGGFIAFDDATDLVAVAAGVSRFLAVESCGQCTPCKQDGLALSELLARVARSEGEELDLAAIADRAATVTDGARCFLAQQHQNVVTSALRLFDDELREHVARRRPGRDPFPVAPIATIEDGQVTIEGSQLDKQPDWTFDRTDSGKAPADRIDERAGDRG
jgi:NADH:ubiquinone oxidoreductase subunit F (NADH-binding)